MIADLPDMQPYFFANLVVWILVLIVAATGAFTAAFRKHNKVRYGDPMRLATFLVASLFIGHAVRWLWAPQWDEAWKALFVGGMLTGLYVIRLMFTYGRGTFVLRQEAASDE